jgi:hypothetical protein
MATRTPDEMLDDEVNAMFVSLIFMSRCVVFTVYLIP